MVAGSRPVSVGRDRIGSPSYEMVSVRNEVHLHSYPCMVWYPCTVWHVNCLTIAADERSDLSESVQRGSREETEGCRFSLAWVYPLTARGAPSAD